MKDDERFINEKNIGKYNLSLNLRKGNSQIFKGFHILSLMSLD